jgi:lipopolysaccharide/colanic/teichoic acid biosynthesis glycosyltransferase
LDILVSVWLLVVFARPILAISLVLIVLRAHPVFLRVVPQNTSGKPFLLIKFRTLASDPNERN